MVRRRTWITPHRVDHRSIEPTATAGQATIQRPRKGRLAVYHQQQRISLVCHRSDKKITVSGAKSMIYKSPGQGFTVLEMDMYYPLPDYRFRFSQLRLGEIAMLPSVAPPPAKLMTTTTTVKPSLNTDHAGHEVLSKEVQEYLKDHPDTWVPPGYGKDRSDSFPTGTYNPYVDRRQQSSSNQGLLKPYSGIENIQSTPRKIWDSNSANNHRYIPRVERSQKHSDQDEDEYELEEEEDRFNISHLRDWEHFNHYRERRELFHTLETGFGSRFDVPIRSCIMRAICEARGLLLPRGKSMITDIVRIVLNVPLREDLHDDYSKAMRVDGADCREVYGRHCPISLLYLFLLGKFVP